MPDGRGHGQRLAAMDGGWYRTVEAYRHDERGNVIAQRDCLGHTTTVDYDADEVFPVSAVDAAGGTTRVSFDARSGQRA